VLKFFLETTRTIALAMTGVVAPVVAARTVLWALGVVRVVVLWDKLPLAAAVLIGASLLVAAVHTGAQWIQGRSFPD
jgi:hypothetical protein